MIKELRIGNFVNKINRDHLIHFPESEILVIQEIGYDCVVYPLGSNPANLSRMPIVYCGDLSPISLTEKWLLKFGWIWNEETNTYEKFPNGDARMHIHLNSLGGHTMFNYVLKATIANRIMHVHQLQNLYFALVGEELQIKETAQ